MEYRVPRLIELSHVIRAGMTTYPGLPGPEISDHLSREASRAHYAAGTEFHIGRISMVANTGTYLDTPAHRYADGADLSGVGLDRLVDLPGLVVALPGDRRAVDADLLSGFDVAGCAVLLHTGWDRHWGTDRYGAGGHPYLIAQGAEWLVQRQAALVGIDSVNIDDTGGGTRPAHSTLLAAGIPIVEHLRGLEALPAQGFRFHAAPPLVAGMGTFPVRAYAVVADE
jgi:arylformamidase